MTGFVDGKRLVSQRVEVKLGIRRPGRVEITEGLSENDTVVVAGQQRLQRDNTPVRVIELGRPPGGAPGSGPSGAPGAAPAAANVAQGSVGSAAPAASTPAPAASPTQRPGLPWTWPPAWPAVRPAPRRPASTQMSPNPASAWAPAGRLDSQGGAGVRRGASGAVTRHAGDCTKAASVGALDGCRRSSHRPGGRKSGLITGAFGRPLSA